MYKVYVRPVLEYNSSVWSPCLKKDIELIEKVQKRFTKRVPGLENLKYQQRLAKLKMHSLEQRRMVADLVQCYKIVYQHSDISFDQFFNYANVGPRDHCLKLLPIPLVPRIGVRKNFFSCRVINAWNGLKESEVTSPSVKTFKSAIENRSFVSDLICFKFDHSF